MTLLATIILMLAPAPARGDSRSVSMQATCDALFEEFVAAYLEWQEAAFDAASTEEAGRAPGPDGAAYAREFLAMAREHPDDPAAPLALARAIEVDPFGGSRGEAIDRLAGRHARSPAIGRVLYLISHDMTRPDIEPFLRRVVEENPSAMVRAEAVRALANHLLRIAGEGRNLREHPDRAEHAARAVGEEGVRRLRDRDEAALRGDAERLLGLMGREYGDLPFDDRRGITFGEHAEAVLRELRELVVGEPAPEISGVDAEGRPLALSDYRGKVVVLDWWASWCGPCMAMVPHLRELARHFEGRPFAILGVNVDEDECRMRQQVEERGIAWRSWVDGGPDGPISTFWNVTSWPTVYVIDADGIIRYKGGRDEAALDRAVEEAMAMVASPPPIRE